MSWVQNSAGDRHGWLVGIMGKQGKELDNRVSKSIRFRFGFGDLIPTPTTNTFNYMFGDLAVSFFNRQTCICMHADGST